MNAYQARLEARRQRLEAAADAATAESARRLGTARTMASAIPFGQPILIGHHSEKRDRNYRGRIAANYRKGFEAMERAKELAGKAASVGTAGISSEDPDAVDLIGAKLAKLEKLQADMKAANAAIRKHRKAGPEAQVAALVLGGINEAHARELLKPDFCGRIGFADYQLQNNGAEIRRLKARVPRVQAIQAAIDAPAASVQVGAVEIIEEEARVQLRFPGKPAEAIRADLRRHGFKWSPTRGTWVRLVSEAARYHAKRIAALV